MWGLLLVSTGDNLIRPWLISQGVKMPLALVILGVFGGFLSLGFLGLFVGPALLAAAFSLLRSWRAQAYLTGGLAVEDGGIRRPTRRARRNRCVLEEAAANR